MEKSILLLLIIVLILFIVLLPTFIKLIQARMVGANIPIMTGILMSYRKTLNKDLITAIAITNKSNLKISHIEMESIFLAGLSPTKCINGILHANKKGMKASLSEISAIGLAGKNIIETIDLASQAFVIQFSDDSIRDNKLNRIKLFYKGEFSINLMTAGFGFPDEKQFKNEITKKIAKYFEYANTTDYTKSCEAITNTLIDYDYWKNKGLELVTQDLIIEN